MAKYLVVASYTAEGIKGVVSKGGSARKEAVTKMVTGLGGKVESFYFGFGEGDAFVTLDLPDNVSAAALGLAVSATGLASTKTIVLLTAEEIDSRGQDAGHLQGTRRVARLLDSPLHGATRVTRSALLIGGTGPTGPPIARGLEARGFDVTILHSGNHEVPEVAHLRHLHGDVFSDEGLRDGVGRRVLRCHHRELRATPSDRRRLAGPDRPPLVHRWRARLSRFLRPRDPSATRAPDTDPRRTADLATEADDGKSYRIGRTEQLLFDTHPTATHFRYPYVYGPRQLAPREWCIVRRVLDGRPFLILPDDGLSLIPFGYVDNLAHALLLADRSATGVDG